MVYSFNELLTKEVNRREFLITAGLVLLTVTGISGVIKSLTSLTDQQQTQSKGFGSGPYGQ